jgi:hypothetical protein
VSPDRTLLTFASMGIDMMAVDRRMQMSNSGSSVVMERLLEPPVGLSGFCDAAAGQRCLMKPSECKEKYCVASLVRSRDVGRKVDDSNGFVA